MTEIAGTPRLPEMTPTARELVRRVQLQGVRLYRHAGELFGIDPGEQLAEVDIEFQVGGGRSPDRPDRIQALIKGAFRFRPSKESKKVIASIECDFVLEYLVHPADILDRATAEDLVAFASTNGFHNSWPYLREFCQSTLARMQLPHFTLPTFRLADPQTKAPTSAHGSSSSDQIPLE